MNRIRGQKLSRRRILIAGLLACSALTMDAQLGGCSLLPAQPGVSTSSASPAEDGQRRLSVSWQGIDFAWLPDNIHIACASQQGLSIIDTRTGLTSWKQRGLSVYDYTQTRALTWSANATRVAYSADNAVLVLDVMSGQPLWNVHVQTATGALATLAPDGSSLALTYASLYGQPGKGVAIWDIQSGKQCVQYSGSAFMSNTDNIEYSTWSPDNTRVAVTSQQGTVAVWDLAHDKLLWNSPDQESNGPGKVINWSPDGSLLAVACVDKHGQSQLGVWDANSGKTRFQVEADVSLTDLDTRSKDVAWSPDGSRIVFGITGPNGKPAFQVWSVSQARPLFTCQQVSSGQPVRPTWSLDGRYLAAGNYVVGTGELLQGDNGDRSSVQFWDAHSGKLLFAYHAPKSPDALTWSANSRYLALITPTAYGVLSNKTCLSMCRFGYEAYALQTFQVG